MSLSFPSFLALWVLYTGFKGNGVFGAAIIDTEIVVVIAVFNMMVVIGVGVAFPTGATSLCPCD
jgi:hypothetical protein